MLNVDGRERCWDAYRDSRPLTVDEPVNKRAERNANAKPTGHQSPCSISCLLRTNTCGPICLATSSNVTTSIGKAAPSRLSSSIISRSGKSAGMGLAIAYVALQQTTAKKGLLAPALVMARRVMQVFRWRRDSVMGHGSPASLRAATVASQPLAAAHALRLRNGYWAPQQKKPHTQHPRRRCKPTF